MADEPSAECRETAAPDIPDSRAGPVRLAGPDLASGSACSAATGTSLLRPPHQHTYVCMFVSDASWESEVSRCSN